MNNEIKIIEVKVVDDKLVEAFTRLLPQLSDKAKAITKADLEKIVTSDNALLIIAVANDTIVGTITLLIFNIPTGTKARIEDVVVDDACRGKGIGQKLISYAIEKATQAQAACIDLTSNPNRESANKLYQKMGFEQRQTNIYRRTLSP